MGVPELTEIGSRPIQSFLEEPLIIGPDETASKALGILASRGQYEALVRVNGGVQMIGLRSILRAKDITRRKVATLTLKPPLLTLDDTVSRAAETMSEMRVRTLPVTDSRGKLAGQVSSTRILQELALVETTQLRAMDLMTPHPLSVDSASTLDGARQTMIGRGIDHLPVTRDGRLVGILMSQDLASHMIPAERASKGSMTPETRTRGSVKVVALAKEAVICSPDTPAFKVLRSILEQEKTAALVMVWDEVQGIITLRDYVKLLGTQPAASTLPVYLVNLPDDPFEASQAQAKFRKAVEALRRVYPKIVEARATVRVSSPLGERKRFEVKVSIRMPGDRFGFTEEAWSLADAFDKISLKLKRLMTKPEKKHSYRDYPARSEFG